MDVVVKEKGWHAEVGSTLLMNTVIGLGITALVVLFSGGRANVGRMLLANQVYAHTIGTIAAVCIPGLAHRLHRRPPWIFWPTYIVALILAGIAGAAIAAGIMLSFGWYGTAQYMDWFFGGARVAVMLTVIIGVATFVVERLRGRLQQTTLELKTQQLERERAAKEATEAQLNSLQSRLQPHFLFNTINSIQALIVENPKQAEEMLGRLSRLLRYSLDTQHRTLVPLSEELRLLTDYLEIEQVRFGSRLRFELDVPGELGELKVPPYSLQTLVENSMKFAVATRREGGRIGVSARRSGGEVELTVQDDGPGFVREAITDGHGLQTLERRLSTLYGLRGTLAIENGDGAKVTVRFPA